MLDRDSPLPLYYQLKQVLLERIRNGQVRRGEALPTEKELEEQYGVSQITVRRALRDLATEGYISRQAGRGTFVLEPKIQLRSDKLGHIRDYLEDRGFTYAARVLEHTRKTGPEDVARQLGIDECQPVLYVRKLILADGEPLMVTTGYYNLPEEIAFTREELEGDSLLRVLEHKYGISLHHAERFIGATAATEEEARLLSVERNAPLLSVQLFVYNHQDQCVSAVHALYRSDRYKYHHTIA